jgi:hypothetical protein
MFVWLLLTGPARILSRRLLAITKHRQAHTQSTNRSNSDSLHTSLLVSVTTSRAKQPKNQMRMLSIADIRSILISENNLDRNLVKKRQLLVTAGWMAASTIAAALVSWKALIVL